MNGIEQETADGRTLIRLRGEVDLSWSQQVRQAVLDALAKSRRVGVVLSDVSYIDSSGSLRSSKDSSARSKGAASPRCGQRFGACRA